MGKKRSKGVTFWAWLFIIFAILNLLALMNPKQQIQLFGMGIFIFGIVVSLAYLICGIFILKLNEAARKTAIFLGVISIILIPVYINPVFNSLKSEDYFAKPRQRIIEQMKPEYQQKALENFEKSKVAVRKTLPIVIIVVFVLPWLLLELTAIYFFTRPSVKDAFQHK